MTKIAIIRIRGQVGMNPKRKNSLELIGLEKKYSAKLAEDTPSLKGQLHLLEPDITWGEANEETIKILSSKKVHHLKPPHKGLGRKGIKLSFKNKGAYGYRGPAINELIKRMI
ncbi:uL30 family ribosomal protein [Candidatus Woesearchaeota archaeon]|nr:uL30 family ribosomal protein [Candidatus Woesearchaeota archaeon]